ncbi:hypothetical protein [Okeania sp. KiyG1]|uniref:hypothetical protein n=1 Tax=Okeania sp. KiyG1 TaxID=2720165 RepID=UPI00192094CB|nr:hypothetical protein [Okeania sp. KiyG1]
MQRPCYSHTVKEFCTSFFLGIAIFGIGNFGYDCALMAIAKVLTEKHFILGQI